MSPLTLPTLPNEICDFILKGLPIEDLASVSLLSRAWQAHAFPHLYRMPCLCLEEHLEQFAERLAVDDGHGPLSISANMKGLILYLKFMAHQSPGRIVQDSLDYLKAIVPRLPRLERLSWELWFVPDDLEIFPLFQRQCPKITSLYLHISNSRNNPCDSDQYRALFNFTGLTHISILHDNLPASFEQDQLAFLSSMLIASPNLVSLKLNLTLQNLLFERLTLSPDALVSSLGDQFNFRSLRTFHLRGTFHFNWDNFFTRSNTAASPLRAFFTRHPGIQDLVLDSNYRPYRGEIQPNDLAQLFPLLKHFEGPAFLCKSLVHSSLAEQLETLIIMDEMMCEGAGLREIAEGAKPLPRLRQLTILGYSSDDGEFVLRVSAIKDLLQGSTMLAKLDTNAVLDDYPLLIELLKRLPNLRDIELSDSILSQAGKHENGGEELAQQNRKILRRQEILREQGTFLPLSSSPVKSTKISGDWSLGGCASSQ